MCSKLLEKSAGEELAESDNRSPEFSDPKPNLLPSNRILNSRRERPSSSTRDKHRSGNGLLLPGLLLLLLGGIMHVASFAFSERILLRHGALQYF